MVSANDAAVAIAERVAGSRENFSAVMARTAERLHMQDHPVLNDPAGLDDEFSVGGGNRISAFDLAVATRAAMAVDQIRAVVATQVYRFRGPDNNDHRLLNHNLMLKTYPGGIGVKTGYTKHAGHSLITAATRDGRTMVSVVLNAPDPDHFSAALLDKGFATPLAAEAAREHMPAVVGDASLDPAASQAPGLVRTPTAHAVPSQADPGSGTDYARQVGWVGLAVIPISILLLRRRVTRRRRYLFR
jgi:D-alanyl-D-alanine carboxypeptidase